METGPERMGSPDMKLWQYILLMLVFWVLAAASVVGFLWACMEVYNTYLVPVFHYPVFPFAAWLLAVALLTSIASLFRG